MTGEELSKRHYLSELPKEEIEKLILYPSDLWNDIYEIVAEDNGNYASELMQEILGRGYRQWTRFDSSSYDWWMHISPGHYVRVLDIDQYDYFSDDDAKKVKELQAKVKKLCDKVENLEDTVNYYDQMSAWEDEADKLADEILQIVVKIVKGAEEVTDEQCVETFIANDMGDDYYYLGDDKGTVYRDYTKHYKTNYKGE